MIRSVGLPLSLGSGLLSALLYLSVVKDVSLGAMLSYVAPLPLMMAGLGLGRVASLIGGAAGTAAVGLVAGEVFAVPYLAAAVLPSILVAERGLLWRALPDGTKEWFPAGGVLAWLTAAGLVLLLIGAALVSGHPDGVRGWVAETIGRVLDLAAGQVKPEERKMAVEWWTPLFPGVVFGSWLVMVVLNATLAQGLLARLGRNLRPTPAYRELWLPDWPGVLVVAAGLAGMLAGGDAGYIAANVAAVTLVPFAFLGVATVHRWAANRPNARLVLALTYGLLILVFAWAALAAAGLGLVRFWTMRFRRRRGGGGEEV